MTKLQERRKASGMSQSQLAEASGVNLRMIQAYEINRKDLNQAAASTVKKLADALGCQMEDLID